MPSNFPTVKRRCEQCDRAHAVVEDNPDRHFGVVMRDDETGLWLCHECWARRGPRETRGPDRPNNRIS